MRSHTRSLGGRWAILALRLCPIFSASAALDVADRSERASIQPEGSYCFGGVEHSSSFEPSGGGEVARFVLVGFEEVLNSVFIYLMGGLNF